MKTLISTLMLCTLLSGTALAKPHEKGHHDMHHNKADMELMMKDGQAYSDSAVHMMEAGNMMIKKGNSSKDAKMMIHGAHFFLKGFEMHRHSMHGMKEHAHKMKHHLMHAKVGDEKMSSSEMKKLEDTMNGLKKYMENHKHATHAQLKDRTQHAHMMVTMGKMLIEEGKAQMNADKLKHGAKLMKLGMKFHMLFSHGHHGKHGKKVMKKIMMKKGHGMQTEVEIEVTDGPGMKVEEEIEIIRK